MDSRDKGPLTTEKPPIYIVSGGTGSSGEQLVNTVLAQFPENRVEVVLVSQVRQLEEIEKVVAQAATTGGTIIHTLVDGRLRGALLRLGQERSVVTIDLMGPLFSRLTDVLGREPVGQPGLYRQLHQSYFDRIEAIEFSISHDDGMKPGDLSLADIVLLGVSRVGKTPLSAYLAVLGWKVANVPLVMELPLPPKLFQINPRRVIGLSIEPDQLIVHRQRRQSELGLSRASSYTDPVKIYEEVEAARKVFRRGGFSVISVTNKPIETIANQVIRLISRRFNAESRKR
jgi:regulator of PEP synthase PpsR (kinase-PPPase family)